MADPPCNGERAAKAAPSTPIKQTPIHEDRLDDTRSWERVADRKRSHDIACDCWCWHCTVGPAVDRAIVTGHRVAVDTTDLLVIPNVAIIELGANGIDVIDLAGYPAVHRAGTRLSVLVES